MGNWITDPAWWSLGVSAVALFVSAAAIYVSSRSSKNLQAQQQQFDIETRRQSALENAQAIIIEKVASMNGVLNVMFASVVDLGQISKEKAFYFYGEIPRLYAEVRNTYKGIEHHLDEVSRDGINQKINEIESQYEPFIDSSDLSGFAVELVLKQISTCNCIRDKLTEVISSMDQ